MRTCRGVKPRFWLLSASREAFLIGKSFFSRWDANRSSVPPNLPVVRNIGASLGTVTPMIDGDAEDEFAAVPGYDLLEHLIQNLEANEFSRLRLSTAGQRSAPFD